MTAFPEWATGQSATGAEGRERGIGIGHEDLPGNPQESRISMEQGQELDDRLLKQEWLTKQCVAIEGKATRGAMLGVG